MQGKPHSMSHCLKWTSIEHTPVTFLDSPECDACVAPGILSYNEWNWSEGIWQATAWSPHSARPTSWAEPEVIRPWN